MADVQLQIFDKKEFRDWLSVNHDKEKKVALVLHKKHTGKPSPGHHELMEEAICFGWIDTTIKRIDDARYIRYFCRRNEKSTWSNNTLKYARQLIKKGRMTDAGLVFFKLGLKKKPHDFEIPKNPEVPAEMKEILAKNKKADEAFKNLAPSSKRNYLRWIVRAKLPETKKKRIDSVLQSVLKSKKPGMFKDI